MSEPTEQPEREPEDEDRAAVRAQRAQRVMATSAGLAAFGFTAVFVAVAVLASPWWALLVAGVLALWFSYVASTRGGR